MLVLVSIVALIVVVGGLWMVMERNPHHQFIDACGNNSPDKLLKFLERSPDLDKAGWFGLTPLGEAIRGNQVENVKTLLGAGAALAIPGARQTHLHTAVQEGALEIVEVLLKSGADPSAKNYIGESPLKLAGEAFKVPIFKLLLENGANPNGGDGMPGIPGEPLIVRLVAKVLRNLKPEAVDQLLEMVGLLLDHGANLNVRNQDGVPLVGLAMPHVKMLRFLVDGGAITDVSWNGTDLKEAIAILLGNPQGDGQL
ncbi:MAG: ankyrin repeat domain-containing protein [Fimbriimonadaceae bacterium]